MSYIKENFHFTKSMPFLFYETKDRQEMIHSHDCLELNYIIDGEGYYLIENKSYEIKPGDIFVINNMEHHMAVHEKSLSMLVFVFDQSFVWEASDEYDYLKPFFQRGHSFSNRITEEAGQYEQIKDAIFHMKEEYVLQETGWELITKSWLMVTLALLYRYYSACDALDKEIRNSSYERIRSVVEYIHENFAEELTLSELADIVHMNKTYLSTCFSNGMHMKVFDYIELVRVNQAKVLLKTTDQSVLDIALQCGFKSSSYFARIFKRTMGVTPMQYRKNKR